MWLPIALGLSLGVAIYGLLKQEGTVPPGETPLAPPTAPVALSPSAVRTAALTQLAAQAPASERDLVTRRAIACGVQETDLQNTTLMTAKYFGYGPPLQTRLILMRSVYPYPLWPEFAKRIDCALRGD